MRPKRKPGGRYFNERVTRSNRVEPFVGILFSEDPHMPGTFRSSSKKYASAPSRESESALGDLQVVVAECPRKRRRETQRGASACFAQASRTVDTFGLLEGGQLHVLSMMCRCFERVREISAQASPSLVPSEPK